MTLCSDFYYLPKPLLWCLLYMLVVMNKFQATKCQHLDKSLSDFELGENCEALLEHYASITANFTRCVIRYARPIMICQKCINEILAVRKSHDDILKLHEESGEACKEELLNVDRLNVIESSFSFVGGQWKNAECEKCFTPGHEINSKTMKVFELYHKTENCLTASKKRNSTTLCDDCKSSYSMLNDFYNANGCHEGFCMDVIDMMNTTRYEWSRKYNCSTTRERPEFLFFTSSVIICLLPIFFYSLIWFFSTFRFPEVSMQNRWSRRFRNLSHTV